MQIRTLSTGSMSMDELMMIIMMMYFVNFKVKATPDTPTMVWSVFGMLKFV